MHPLVISLRLPAIRAKSDNKLAFTRHRILLAAAAIFVSLTALPQVAPIKNEPPPEARVDVNHATIDELLKVPGMTPSWAGRIVRFRPYRAKNDLVEHGVVTNEFYARIKDYIVAHRSN